MTAPTTPTPLRVTVLGVTGGIGRAIAELLVTRGHHVLGASRSGTTDLDGVTAAAVDLSDAARTMEICADADVVVLAAQPPYPRWVAEFPGLLDNVIAATSASGARLVFVDNLYAYAPATGPIGPDSPPHATDPKGVLRRQLGERLLAAHREGSVRAVIGRFSDYYGPGGTNSGLYMTGIRAALRGRRPRALFALDQPHTFHYLPDAAAGFVRLVEDDRGDGRTWVLPAAPPITQRDLLRLVARATGLAKEPGVIPAAMLHVAGWFDRMLRETRSVRVQFDRPWVVDGSAFETTFGPVATTPHEQAVAATVAWFREDDRRARGADLSPAAP